MLKSIIYTLFALILVTISFENAKAQHHLPLTANLGHNKSTGKFYEVRGFRMYVEEYGSGKPLLLIHGNGGSIKSFINQVPIFSQSYRVIIADSRAQGQSMDDRDSLSYEMMTDDYETLLKMLKIDSAYVIGWSDGGIIGLQLAIKYPESVKKLIVSGANLVPDTTAINQDVLQLVRPDYQKLLENPHKTAEERNEQKLLRLLMEEPHISTADLHRIECPTLVIGGDHDIIKQRHLMQISENITKSYLWIVPCSGHSVPVVYKDLFNQTVAGFLLRPYKEITGNERFN